MTPSADPIAQAARRIAGGVARTPTVVAPALACRLGLSSLALKLETLQRTGSFKERGALNRLLLLSEEERRRGVVTLSAGNHAQGVAYHAARLGIPATVVMPRHTPNAKVARTRAHGAEVLLIGETLVESAQEVRRLVAERGLVLVHPYDDEAVIAGQGTATAELLEDEPDLDVLVVPIGGGGLIAGAALAARTRPKPPRLVGVEVEGWAACAQRLAGEPVSVGGATIAEGIAVRDIGEIPFAIIRAQVERVLVVPETAIETAIGLLVEEAKLV
ncbi:MAG: pyridoxal-phosphate dependent enzyme, partial [Elioraea sp.]|nr:pyridoxal-phosphate dependent enzyme [Elioraea sp.]